MESSPIICRVSSHVRDPLPPQQKWKWSLPSVARGPNWLHIMMSFAYSVNVSTVINPKSDIQKKMSFLQKKGDPSSQRSYRGIFVCYLCIYCSKQTLGKHQMRERKIAFGNKIKLKYSAGGRWHHYTPAYTPYVFWLVSLNRDWNRSRQTYCIISDTHGIIGLKWSFWLQMFRHKRDTVPCYYQGDPDWAPPGIRDGETLDSQTDSVHWRPVERSLPDCL